MKNDALELIGRAYDLALLQTAAFYDLHSRKDRAQSHRALVAICGQLLTRALKPELVLELGAFSAEFSRRHRASLPDTVFHAFEANPHNFERFRSQVEADGVRYHHAAIGESVGTCAFNLARKQGGQDVSPKRGSHSLRTKPLDIEYEEIPVEMVTVDHFVRQHALRGKTTALWIDVEGCAHEALRGAEQTLADTQLIFVEVEDRPFWNGQKLAGEVRSLLLGAGFIPVARDFESKFQYNMIFATPELYDRVETRQVLANGFSMIGKGRRTA